eukprot:gene23794-biopygen13397
MESRPPPIPEPMSSERRRLRSPLGEQDTGAGMARTWGTRHFLAWGGAGMARWRGRGASIARTWRGCGADMARACPVPPWGGNILRGARAHRRPAAQRCRCPPALLAARLRCVLAPLPRRRALRRQLNCAQPAADVDQFVGRLCHGPDDPRARPAPRPSPSK